jgi:hypothetical protein
MTARRAESWLGWRVTLLVAVLSLTAQAQSIGDSVRQHLDQGLEGDKKKPAAKPAPRKASKPSPKPAAKKSNKRPAGDGSGFSWNSDAPPEPEPPPDPDPLPRRVFGEMFKLDPTAGAGYRGWAAQDYPRIRVPHTGFFTWNVDVKGRFFRYLVLKRGYYESNGLSAPRNQTASTAAQIGSYAPKAAWLLGALGFEISKAWMPIISYETRAFESTAIPRSPVRIVPFDAPEDTDWETLPQTTERLRVVSGFETFVAGVRYDHSRAKSDVIGSGRTNTIPPFYLGVGLIQYSKPYQVRVGSGVLGELLFDTRFRGAGLALGFNTAEQPDKFYVDFKGQLGLGEVRLLRDLTLNEGLPSDWLIGYTQGDLTIGYLYPLVRSRPTVFISAAVNGGGMSFFFFKTKAEEGEETSSPALNWDFLWGARVALTIPL